MNWRHFVPTAVALYFLPSVAFACSCLPYYTTEEALEVSTSVFSGEVISIEVMTIPVTWYAEEVEGATPLQDVETQFLDAVRSGDLASVRAFLESGVNVDARDDNDYTALMIASYEGRLLIVEALIERGADLNAPGPDGLSALILSIDQRRVSVQLKLQDSGAFGYRYDPSQFKQYDEPPTVLERPPPPKYPEAARQAGIKGVVRVHVRVGIDGSTRILGVIQAYPYLTLPSIEYMKQWRYTPATKNGQPIEAENVFTMSWNLSRR